jgi:hypothetical protein
MSLYQAYFIPGGVDPTGATKGGVEFSIGASGYKGGGGGLAATVQMYRESCCLANGAAGQKDVVDVRIHGEVGLGLGIKIDFIIRAVELQYTILKIPVNIGGECESPCVANGGAAASCCRVCADIGIELPFILPMNTVGVGLASFSFGLTMNGFGTFRICWNSSGCPSPGLGAGFTGGVTISATASYGWFFVEESKNMDATFMILGTPDMIDW